MAAELVASLAQLPANRRRVAEESGVQRLVLLCGTAKDGGVLRAAAEALALVAEDEECRAQVLQRGAVPPLVELCSLANQPARVLASAAKVRGSLTTL
jgi:hypothetical protein